MKNGKKKKEGNNQTRFFFFIMNACKSLPTEIMRVAVIAIILALAVAVQSQSTSWENILGYVDKTCSGNVVYVASKLNPSCAAMSCAINGSVSEQITCTSSAYTLNRKYFVSEINDGANCTGNAISYTAVLADGNCYGGSYDGTTAYFKIICDSSVSASLCTDSSCSACTSEIFPSGRCDSASSTKFYCTASNISPTTTPTNISPTTTPTPGQSDSSKLTAFFGITLLTFVAAIFLKA